MSGLANSIKEYTKVVMPSVHSTHVYIVEIVQPPIDV